MNTLSDHHTTSPVAKRSFSLEDIVQSGDAWTPELDNSLWKEIEIAHFRLRTDRSPVIPYTSFLVLRRLSSAAPMCDEDIFRIKDFTKVANHVLKGNEALSKRLYKMKLIHRLYDFHIEGIEKTGAMLDDPSLKQADSKEYRDQNLKVALSHFHGHAAEVCMIIYDHIRGVSFDRLKWAYRAYKHLDQSTPLEKDHRFLLHRYKTRGDLALKLYEQLKKNNQWPKKEEYKQIAATDWNTKALNCYKAALWHASRVHRDDQENRNYLPTINAIRAKMNNL